MKFVNVFLAITDDTWDLLKLNFQWIDEEDHSQGRERNDLTLPQARKLRHHRRGFWPVLSRTGGVFEILSFDVEYITVANNDPKLKWVEFLLNKWAGKFIVLGTWYKFNAQFSPPYGIEIHLPQYDENGDRITTPPNDDDTWKPNVKYGVWWRGAQVYPQHPRLLEAMPDDPDGSPATDFKQVHGTLGHGDRMYL